MNGRKFALHEAIHHALYLFGIRRSGVGPSLLVGSFPSRGAFAIYLAAMLRPRGTIDVNTTGFASKYLLAHAGLRIRPTPPPLPLRVPAKIGPLVPLFNWS